MEFSQVADAPGPAPDPGPGPSDIRRGGGARVPVGAAETKPYGAEQVREAYPSAGDTVALIVQSRKGGAKAVPFLQTITLQSQLLS